MRRSKSKATTAALGMLCFAALTVVLSGRPALAATGCHDAYMVTARGSGETNSGDSTSGDPIGKVLTGTPELHAVYSGIIDAGSSAWGAAPPDIEVHQLTYPALDVHLLLSKVDQGSLTQRTKRLLDHNLPSYLSQERQGEQELSDYLGQILTSCAGTDKHPAVVLAGYSQGAMAVHNILQMLMSTGASAKMDLIAGSVLVADPERMPLSRVTNLGTALPLLTSYGLCPALDLTSVGQRSCLAHGHSQEVPSRFLPTTVQICDTGDLVCDAGTVLSALNPIQFTAGVFAGVHTHIDCNAYCATSARSAGAFLGRQLLSRGVGLAPLSVATGTLPTATLGVLYVAALNAQGGLAPFTWSVAPGSLPAGLSLSTDGNLTGTPSGTGTYQLPVTVTDAIGHTASVTVTLVVTPPADGLTVYGGSGPAGTVTWITGITCPVPAPGDTMWVITQGAGQDSPYVAGAFAYPVYHGGAPVTSTENAPVGTVTASIVCAENSDSTSAAGAVAVKNYSITQTITGPSRQLKVDPANDGLPGFRYTISDGGGCGTSPHGLMGVTILVRDDDRPTVSMFTGLSADAAGRWGPVTLPFPASATVAWHVQVMCRVGVGADNSGYNYPTVQVPVP